MKSVVLNLLEEGAAKNQNGRLSIDAEMYSEEDLICAVWCRWEIVLISYKALMLYNERKKWFPLSRPPGMR